MRMKRSNRSRNSKRKAVYRFASLLTVSALGIGQMTNYTYALLTSRAEFAVNLSTACVFPQTITDKSDEAGGYASQAAAHAGKAHGSLNQVQASDTSQNARQLAVDVAAEAALALQMSKNISGVLTELSGYAEQARRDADRAESAWNALLQKAGVTLEELQAAEIPDNEPPASDIANRAHEMNLRLKQAGVTWAEVRTAHQEMLAAERVLTYVVDGYTQVKGFANEANTAADAADRAVQEAGKAVEAKVAEEKRIADEKAKKEAADQAAKEAADKAAADKAAADKAAADKAAADKAAADKAAGTPPASDANTQPADPKTNPPAPDANPAATPSAPGPSTTS